MFIHWFLVFLIFVVVSLAHELGHILALLAFRVPIHGFKVGFGPVIWGKNFKKSAVKRLRVGLIPFGVGVGFDGDHFRFKSLGFWVKVLVFSSGVLLNAVIAVIVSFFVGFGDVMKPSPQPNDLVDISRIFVVLNLMLAMCQLLPFARFDGGKILNEVTKKYLHRKDVFFVSNLKISITILLTTIIFHIYRFWT